MCNKGKLVILTGVSGSGKTTISRYIEKEYKNVVVIRYGEVLYEMIKKVNPEISYLEFKENSSTLINRRDIALADMLIVSDAFDKTQRGLNVIIESHAVTNTPYGLRVSPYSAGSLDKLVINSIIVMYTDGKTISRRLGLPRPPLYEIANNMQNSLALSYALLHNSEVHVIDNCNSLAESTSSVGELLSQIGVKNAHRKNT